MFLLKYVKIQTNKFSSAIEIFIAFVVTPYENYGIFCHFGGYDKGFYGKCINFLSIKVFHIVILLLVICVDVNIF